MGLWYNSTGNAALRNLTVADDDSGAAFFTCAQSGALHSASFRKRSTVRTRTFSLYDYGEMNMSIAYRRLTKDDLETFVGMRIIQLREEGATENIDLRPSLMDYCHRHMDDGTFVSWLALDGGKIVGTSGMSFVEKPPYFSCPSGRIGLLSSMYTDPGYRRRGIAKELLRRVVEEARAYGCGAVQITASDMGVLLYTDFGFVKNGNFMQYKL